MVERKTKKQEKSVRNNKRRRRRKKESEIREWTEEDKNNIVDPYYKL